MLIDHAYRGGQRGGRGRPRSSSRAHRVLRLETLSEADGQPLSRATSHFDAARFDGLEQIFAETRSITAAVQEVRHRRLSQALDAGLGAPCRRRRPGRPAPVAGSIVLCAVAVNVDPEGRPIQYAETRFAADRVELSVSTER